MPYAEEAESLILQRNLKHNIGVGVGHDPPVG